MLVYRVIAAPFEGFEAAVRQRAEAAARAGRPLRAWVAPCGAGALAYSVALVMMETLGRRWRETPLRVLATDSDPAAIARARAGLFARDAFPWLSPERRERFFSEDPAGLRARALLREACRFTTADASRKASASHLDLVVTREGLLTPADDRRCDETLFQTLLSQAGEAIVVCDAATGAVVEANAAAEVLYGRTRPELLALRDEDLLAPQGRARRPEGERRSLRRPRLPHHRRGDGGVFPADHRKVFIMWRGRPSSLWVVSDAAERLRARSVEAANAFMGEVVHELRAPVAVIQGFAETLRLGVRKPKDRLDFLRAIESQSLRVGRLVDQLLDLSAAQRGHASVKPQPISAAQAVWDVAALFAPLARRRGVKIAIDIAAGLAASADPSDVPHILGNLLDNAVKFSARGGTVAVLGRAQGGQALLSVEDAGPGIAPEDLERVFERFYRSPRTRAVKGTGLGLAIVRAMAKANGGRVWAENRPSGGTAFHVALPLAPVLESRS